MWDKRGTMTCAHSACVCTYSVVVWGCLPWGLRLFLWYVFVCVSVCPWGVFCPSSTATSPLIGLQRGGRLAGGWPTDHADDPSLPPPQKLRPHCYLSTFTLSSIFPLLSFLHRFSCKAVLTLPAPSWCLSISFLLSAPLQLSLKPPSSRAYFYFCSTFRSASITLLK